MDQALTDILKTIDDAINSFQDKMPGLQKQLFDELQPLLKDIEIKNGKLLNNVKNLRLLGQLKNKLQKIIVSPQYKDAVNQFIDSYDTLSALNITYFKQFNEKFTPAKTLPIIKELAIESTINDLVGQGLQVNVIDAVSSILNTNITTGGSYASLQNQLRNHLLNDDTGDGSLVQYTKQITTDAINQYHAQYHAAIAQDLQFTWGRYVGSLLTTSRQFCILLTKKDWVHKSELPEIIKGHIDGQSCKLSKTTGLPLGMIPGTNADNFKINRGGYQCGHHYFEVPDSAVPDNILNDFNNKGKYLQTDFYAEKKDDINQEFSDKVLQEIESDSGLDYDTIVSLTGGIPKKNITNINHELYEEDGVIKSSISATQYDIVRNLHADDRWIYNAFMKTYEKGTGIGLNLFVNQVKAARENGFEYLGVSAEGNYRSIEDWNGYITWAKFGYIMDKYSQSRFEDLMKAYGRNEKNVFDLVSTKEGADFWEKNGSSWSGTFDLSDNSQAMENLRNYLAVRKINVKL